MQTTIIALHLDKENDILVVNWQDVTEFPRAEVELSFSMIRQTVQKHAFTRLLINSSYTTHVLSKELLAQIVNQYLMAIAGTTLKKVARISSLVPEREAIVVDVLNNVFLNKQLTVQFENFATEEQARKWLLKE